MTVKARNRWKQTLYILIATLTSVVFLFPIVQMVASSLKAPKYIFNGVIFPPLEQLRLENFSEVFTRVNFLQSMTNSFITATAVTIVSIVIQLAAGFAFSQLHFPFRKAIFSWMLSTMMLPFSVMMIPLFQICKFMGLLNTLWAIIIPMIPQAYGIFLYKQFFMGMPRDLFEAAQIDGSGYFGTMLRIYTPLAKPITLALVVCYFLNNWNNYLWPLIVTQDKSLWVVQIAIVAFKGEHNVSWNLIMAASAIATVPTLILYVFLQRYFIDGIKMSGVKE